MPDTLNTFDEPHFTINELAEAKKLHRVTISRLFIDEPGVLRIGHGATPKKKRYYSLRIPESVARRVFGRLTVTEQEQPARRRKK